MVALGIGKALLCWGGLWAVLAEKRRRRQRSQERAAPERRTEPERAVACRPARCCLGRPAEPSCTSKDLQQREPAPPACVLHMQGGLALVVGSKLARLQEEYQLRIQRRGAAKGR